MSASKEEKTIVPDGASCWICMDEASPPSDVKEADGRPSTGGRPLVRDCSCRGTSGFAHFFCLAQYAVNKVSDGGDITKPFRVCPTCNQGYQNQLRKDMADVMIQFADQIDDCDPYRYAEALYTKLLSLDLEPEESKKTAREMIAKLEEVDEPAKCASWAANPKAHSDSAKNLMSLAYEKLGWQFAVEGVRTKGSEDEASEKFNLAIKYYQKYQDLAKAVGNMHHVKDAETKIARTKAMNPLDKSDVKQDLDYLRAEYEKDPSHLACSNLMMALRLEGHEIELERMLAKEIIKNRRLLGPDHPQTHEQELGLKGMSVRKLSLLGEDGKDKDDIDYRFVSYEDDGAKCILSPMKSAHDFKGGKDYEEGKEFAIDTAEMPDKVRLRRGTPVMCVGLAKAAHLNGKIGDSRRFNKETKRYEVHFEDKTLTPRSASVKLSNLRIVQDLPQK